MANQEKTKTIVGFFKMGKGEYGEGDVFLGLTVPQSRSIAKKYRELSFPGIEQLLASKFHEERLIGLLILVEQFQAGSEKARKNIFDFYLAHLDSVNNWDLVDLSADKIVGAYLFGVSQGWSDVSFSKRESNFFPCLSSEHGQQKKILSHFENPGGVLNRLIVSEKLWERRVAMVATLAFIREGDASETLRLAEKVLGDEEDLMHKATGWMLREVGKRVSRKELELFLKKNILRMPRTMLRYAIEHFPEKDRKQWLSAGKKIRTNIMNTRIDRAFQVVSRESFVPEKIRSFSMLDEPLSIGFGQTISQPTTVRMMLEWLDPHRGDHVLDVGSGSGWTTALLSTLVGRSGHVDAVEIVPELLIFGKENCARFGIRNAFFHPAEKVFGFVAAAPYDRILVSASTKIFPRELLDQLKSGGKLVLPVGNDIWEVEKMGERGEYRLERHPGFVFVPLVRKE